MSAAVQAADNGHDDQTGYHSPSHRPPVPQLVATAHMSTRTFLVVVSIAIVVLIVFLMLDQYQTCLAARPAKECPERKPYISRSGGYFGRLPPSASSRP